MQFLKKNYEKILLGLVLAGLIGGLVFMLFYIADDKQKMEDAVNGVINTPVKPLADLDLTTNAAAMARVQSPYSLDFETGNKLFNSFEWNKGPDGRMFKKVTNIAQVAAVTGIAPLYFVLSLDSVATNDLGARYVIAVERQAASVPAKRRKQQRYVSLGEKANDTFALLDVKGAPENPDALIVKLVDTGETVTVTRDKPYRRVDGYLADFRYDPEKKTFKAQREGNRVSFGGADYLVFEVSSNELILSDQSNQKKTSLPFAP
jgi:hypothetical protein